MEAVELQFFKKYPQRKGLYFLEEPSSGFEQNYIDSRLEEGRVYADDLVQQLPVLPSFHPQYGEWKLRWKSTQRLLTHLENSAANHILDLGCGNGWLSKHLAALPDKQIIGADINQRELEQAAALFQGENCSFIYGDIFSENWPERYFDVIVLNACIQYFPALRQLLLRLRQLLSEQGEIHILDSPLYSKFEIAAARQRSVNYFKKQNHPEMIDHYHHHSWEELNNFSHQVIYDPRTIYHRIKRKVFKNDSPFPWIIVYPYFKIRDEK